MFETKNNVAEWRIVYDALAKLGVGDTLDFDQLDELLGRDFRDDRGPIYRAMKELEANDKRTVDSVRGVGYRVVEAREHEGLARRHHKRSRRQLGKAVAKAASADRSAMTAEERKRIDGMEMSLRQHAQMIRRLSERDEQREQQIKTLRRDTTADVAALSERVDRLTDLLERHGVETKS